MRAVVTEYPVGSHTFAWHPQCRRFDLVLRSGAGGGSSGVRSATAETATGGAGGGGGGVSWLVEAARHGLPDTIPIIVGAGGIGGTTPAGEGQFTPGTAGGATSFGDIATVPGGFGGGWDNNLALPALGGYAPGGAGGVGGVGTEAPNGGHPNQVPVRSLSGGGGGGAGSSASGTEAGLGGGSGWQIPPTTINTTALDATHAGAWWRFMACGAGGPGGTSTNPAGRPGGFPCGGGGGGRGDSVGRPGGNGAAGLLIVIEYVTD